MSVQARKVRTAYAHKPFVTAMEARQLSGEGHAPSLEACLYLGALLVAAVSRLLLLDLRPLSVEEGTLAAESYWIAQAQPPESLHQGPLLAYGSALMLAMFGGGDAAARLLPALFGSALVVSPIFLRGVLGRVPALVAAWGLAVSPIMLFASLNVASDVIALALGVGLLWTLGFGLRDAGPWRAGGAAVALSGLLVSGTEGICVGLALGLAALLSHPRPAALVAELRGTCNSRTWRNAAAIFVTCLVVVGSGFGGYLPGVQWAIVDVWTGWFRSFSLTTPRGTLLALLALYEFPVLVLATLQLARALGRRDRVDMFLAMWAMILLLLSMVQDMPLVSRVALPLLPLYFMAARFLGDRIAAAVHEAGRERREFHLGVVLLVPAAAAAILLNSASLPGNERLLTYLNAGVVSAIVLEIAVVMWLLRRRQGPLVWAGVVALSCLYLLHNSAFLNFRGDSLSREPIALSQVSSFLRDASGDAAYYATFFASGISVDPQLRGATIWYLRQVKGIQYSTEAGRPLSLRMMEQSQASLDRGLERRPGLFSPSIIGGGDLTWQGVWRWVVAREGLVTPNQRDIIVRAPAGNW